MRSDEIDEAKKKLPLPVLMHRLGVGEHAKKSARCPFHEDKHNSFSVWQRPDAGWFWKCHSGCGAGDEINFLLLGDVRNIFNRIDADPIPSADLAQALAEMEDRPWPELSRGKPITTVKLALMLKRFRIFPGTKRDGNTTFKGYDRNSFDDAFDRYAPPGDS